MRSLLSDTFQSKKFYNFGVVRSVTWPGVEDMRLQRIEQVASAGRAELVLQSREYRIEQSCRPALFECPGWVRFSPRFTAISCFGILLVERDQCAAASPFLRPGPVILIVQEVFHRRH